MSEPSCPGAIAPERERRLRSGDLELRLVEWGDPEAEPLLLLHGMFDHARGFDLFAPRLADRYRVIAYDARGHGESDWADAYLWECDVEDAVRVLRSLGRPAHLLGHSRGGGLAMNAAARAPACVRGLVNLDGFGPPSDDFGPPGAPAKPLAAQLAGFLDGRRVASRRTRWRTQTSLDALVQRRAQQNPRLTDPWLRYFVFHAARETRDGWVWKSDPHAGRSFGPFRAAWIAPGWSGLEAPVLAITGMQPDTWGPLPEPLLEERLAYLPRCTRARVEGAGHFVHMEQPERVAALVADFLAAA